MVKLLQKNIKSGWDKLNLRPLKIMRKKIQIILVLNIGLCYFVFGQNFPIGTRNITWQDPARNNRNIPTVLYYPATSAGANAPVAMGTFPIVVIGHGFTMGADAYDTYGDTLAQAGYIVAVPTTETGFSPSHNNFGLDLAFLVAKLYAENSNAASPFYQRVQPNSCIMGHSMGAGCALLGAANNPNVTCTVTLALAETNPSAIGAAANVAVPSLVLSGSDDCVTPAATHQTPAYNALPGCKVFVSLTNGGHCGFADFNFNCNFGEMTCNPGGPSMSAATQRAITRALLRPWLDRYLKGNTAAGATFVQQFNTYVAANQVTGVIQCLALPLEWIRWSAERTEAGTRLRWTVAEPRHLAHFNVQKSHDGVTYERLTKVDMVPGRLDYTMLDEAPARPVCYYRMEAVTMDGNSVFSPILTVFGRETPQIEVFPIPFQGAIHLRTPHEEGRLRVTLTDAQGRVQGIWEDVEMGLSTLVIPDLPAGWYLLRVQSEQETWVRAVMKK
jgi:dienelactone hydrolase